MRNTKRNSLAGLYCSSLKAANVCSMSGNELDPWIMKKSKTIIIVLVKVSCNTNTMIFISSYKKQGMC